MLFCIDLYTELRIQIVKTFMRYRETILFFLVRTHHTCSVKDHSYRLFCHPCISDVGTSGATSNNFCNFQGQFTDQSRKLARFKLLSQALFFTLTYSLCTTISVTFGVYKWVQHLQVCTIIHIWTIGKSQPSLCPQPFCHDFKCGHLKLKPQMTLHTRFQAYPGLYIDVHTVWQMTYMLNLPDHLAVWQENIKFY